jgi:hypothetical protein
MVSFVSFSLFIFLLPVTYLPAYLRSLPTLFTFPFLLPWVALLPAYLLTYPLHSIRYLLQLPTYLPTCNFPLSEAFPAYLPLSPLRHLPTCLSTCPFPTLFRYLCRQPTYLLTYLPTCHFPFQVPSQATYLPTPPFSKRSLERSQRERTHKQARAGAERRVQAENR